MGGLSTLEVKTGGQEVQGYPWLHIKSETSLGYPSSHLKNGKWAKQTVLVRTQVALLHHLRNWETITSPRAPPDYL
jgi:hypothetical protein